LQGDVCELFLALLGPSAHALKDSFNLLFCHE
jgi:hypothetical protein